jgi:5'-3' exoribonuclease 2
VQAPPQLHDADRNRAAADALRQSLLGKRQIAAVAEEHSASIDSVTAPVAAATVEETELEVDGEGASPVDAAVGDASDMDEGDALPAELAVALAPKLVSKSMTPAEVERAKEELKKRIKDKEQALIDRNRETIQDAVKLHEAGWKDRYYGEKYKKENIERGGGLQRMAYTYVQGLCWVLKYYYQGVPSWNWYYPFHYAPFASDLRNIDSYGPIEFELSEPFRPIEQLLAVFPANSVKALPEPCRWLMTDPSSPIIDLYDADVPIDPNGKHLPWLWILLLPFVDEKRITAAFELCRSQLSLHDAKKNKFGLPAVFLHKDSSLGAFAAERLRYMPAAETDTEVLRALGQESSKMKMLCDGADEGETEVAVTNSVVPSAEAAQCAFEASVGGGMSGVLAPPPPATYAPLHTIVKAPVDTTFAFQDIRDNKVMCYTYTLLPMPHIHLSVLLDGVVHQQSGLTQFDLMHRRPPRLNKGGFNITDIFQSHREKEQRNHTGQYVGNYANNGGHNGYGHHSQLQYGFMPQYQQQSQYQNQTMAYSGFKQPRAQGSFGGGDGGGGQYQAPYQDQGPPQQQYRQAQDRGGYPPQYSQPSTGYPAYGAPDRYPASYQPQGQPQYRDQRQDQYQQYEPQQQAYQQAPPQAYPAYQQPPPAAPYMPEPYSQQQRQAAPVEHTVTALHDRHTQRSAVLGSHRVDRSVPIGAYSRQPAGGGGGRQAVFLDTLPVQAAPVPPAKFRHGAPGRAAPAAAPAGGAYSGGPPQFRPPVGVPPAVAQGGRGGFAFQQPAAAPGPASGGGDSLQSIRDQLFQTLQQQQAQQQPPRR